MQPRTSVSAVHACGGGFGGEFAEIDADDFVSHVVADPAFFDEGNEQRAGFLERAQVLSCAGGFVGVAVHRGVGGDDQHVSGFGGGAGCGGSGLDNAEDRDWNGILDGIEGQGTGSVAGDDEEFGALFADEELGAFSGIASDGAARLGAVGETGGVPDEGEAGLRELWNERGKDGEPAEAGIEDADGG